MNINSLILITIFCAIFQNVNSLKHYQVLKIPENATRVQITQAYYKIKDQLNPDKYPGDPIVAYKFGEINKAYETLVSPKRRRIYHIWGDNSKLGYVQQQKVMRHFELVDFNQDGVLERDDFELHGYAYAESIKMPAESYVALELEFWGVLSSFFKKNVLIYHEEHAKAMEELMLRDNYLGDFLYGYIKTIWKDSGKNVDEELSFDEFAGTMFTNDLVQARIVFDLLDTPKRGTLTMIQLYSHWMNFFYESKQDSPSNYVFGMFDTS